MSSINGYTRPLGAKVGIKEIGRMETGIHGDNGLSHYANAVYADAAASEKYLDMHDGTQVVAGGYAKLFTNVGLGVLSADTADGQQGDFKLKWKGWLQLNTGDTPAFGDPIYWDDSAKELTTTSSGNTKVGYVASGVGAATQIVTTATFTSLPAGTWVHVQLMPFA